MERAPSFKMQFIVILGLVALSWGVPRLLGALARLV